ncbi:MAG: type I methionyl aminopeptidase [Spirochaetales bacterium]|nr:type I methionyl aminopeptidase [Spirochaetales bacterium]
MRNEVPDIPLKTSIEVNYIRKSCRLIENTLKGLSDFIRPGISTLDINNFCSKMIADSQGGRAIKGYRGYPASVCTSVNQVACHGLPTTRPLENGDIVTVDLTVEIDGWFGDGAWTFMAGPGDADARRLVKAAWSTSMAGIRAIKAGGRLGDVGYAIESTARKFGCRVLENFVGHGIGREIHEDPMVLNRGEPETGQYIVPGMVITVEPILTLGKIETKTLEDGWSIVTCDGRRTAQFENTLAVFGDRVEILTLTGWNNVSSFENPPF